jgi:membrane-associated PAP2 superfamily phosphatase
VSETPKDAQGNRFPGWPLAWRAGRPGGNSPALLSEPVFQGLALVAILTLIFLLFPGLDIWFSGLFYDPNSKFPMLTLGAFIGLRALGNAITWWVPIALVAVVLFKIALPWRTTPVPPRDILFILSTLALGPGLVVNLILKDHWGRPRPWRVDAFGGDQPFVGVWRITHECSTNCSFVSGEASSAIWLLTLVVLLPERWHPLALKVFLTLAVLFSLNRIAMGGHFLSDVLLSWAITLTVIALAWRALCVSPPPWLAADRLEDWLTSLGLRLRRLIRRATG